MKFCPECRESFPDLDEVCPTHGARLFAISAPNKPDYDALVGQTIDGRYQLDQKIGEGGMGVVYSAHHTILAKKVAIKVLKREVARDGSVVKRFIQEARAASTIGHPNIADVHDFGVLPDGHSYFVMDFVVGPTLAQAMKEGIMAPGRALPIMAQLGRALAAAHDKGIIHRDLKPDNVFLTPREGNKDFVKIVDFGIAQMSPEEGSSRLTRAGMVFGTPEYMAPEQAAGREVDHRCDVYACGCILFEMMTGTVPFKGESVMATLAKVIMDFPPRPSAINPHIHPAVEGLIEYAMAKDVAQRCPDMRAFVAAIEDIAHKLQREGVPMGNMGQSQSGSMSAVTVMDVQAGSGAVRMPTAQVNQLGQRPNTSPPRKTPPGLRSWPGAAPDQRTAAMPPLTGEAAVPGSGGKKIGIALGVLAAVAGVTVLALKLFNKKDKPVVAPGLDAGVIAIKVPDAALPAPDAAVAVATPDAQVVAAPTVDAGPPGPSPTAAPPDEFTVTIKTDPPGSDIFVNGEKLGKGKATLKKKKGAKISIVCKQLGFQDQTVTQTVTKSASITCKQQPRCVDGLQNPNPLANCPD